MTSIAISDMLERGILHCVGAADIEDFIQGDGLRVLFFAGPTTRGSDAHDVAVALREMLKDYAGSVSAGLVEQADEVALQPRFRVLALPSLVLVIDGETMQVIPRVRDWTDYTQAFRRYLGDPGHRPGQSSQELAS